MMIVFASVSSAGSFFETDQQRIEYGERIVTPVVPLLGKAVQQPVHHGFEEDLRDKESEGLSVLILRFLCAYMSCSEFSLLLFISFCQRILKSMWQATCHPSLAC